MTKNSSMASPHNEEPPCSPDVAACNPPTSVKTPGADSTDNLISTLTTSQVNSNSFDKFLVIKHQTIGTKLSLESPFKIDKGLKAVLGENHKCRITPKFHSGLLLIEVDRKESHDKLLQTQDLSGIPVRVEPHQSLNISKGTIVCDSLHSYTTDELQAKMVDQDVKEVYRTKKREDGILKDSNLYIITFSKPKIPEEIRVGFLNIKVRHYIQNPWRCERCQRFGHKETHCKHDSSVCAKCGKTDPGHAYDACRDDTCCINCSGNHPASSKQCPLWQLEKKINKMKAECNLKYPEARAQVIYDNPHLVSKIPSLQTKARTKTYSTAAGSSSATEKIQNQQQIIFEQQKKQIEHMQKQIQLLTDIVKGLMLNTTATTSNMSAPERPKRTREVSSSSEEETRPRSKQALTSTSSGQETKNMSAPPPPSDTSIGGAVGGNSSLPSKVVGSTASPASKVGEATPMDAVSVGDPSPPPRRVRDSSRVRDPTGVQDSAGARDSSVVRDQRPSGGGKEPRAPSSNRGGKNKQTLNRNGPVSNKNK